MSKMEENGKKVVSPFEYAIIEICEPQNLHMYREETLEEKKGRIEKNFRSITSRLKAKK